MITINLPLFFITSTLSTISKSTESESLDRELQDKKENKNKKRNKKLMFLDVFDNTD